MVLTPGYIKVIAKEIASQIITELKKPFERSFGEIKTAKMCETKYNDKVTLIDYFKDHERRAHEKIENERKKN
jgi:hypothetical protein